MSYHAAQRRQFVKPYLDQRELERRIAEIDDRKMRSHAWLEKFRATGRASRTSFDWRPRYPFNPVLRTQPPESEPTNVKEADQIIEGEFTEVEPETDFTEKDRTPF